MFPLPLGRCKFSHWRGSDSKVWRALGESNTGSSPRGSRGTAIPALTAKSRRPVEWEPLLLGCEGGPILDQEEGQWPHRDQRKPKPSKEGKERSPGNRGLQGGHSRNGMAVRSLRQKEVETSMISSFKILMPIHGQFTLFPIPRNTRPGALGTRAPLTFYSEWQIEHEYITRLCYTCWTWEAKHQLFVFKRSFI